MQQLSPAEVVVAQGDRSGVERWFYIGTALVALGITVVAFTPSIIDSTSRRAPLTPLVMLHAALFGAWLILYLVQALLAATQRLRLHRRLGTAAVMLAIAMLVVGYQSTMAMVRRGFDLSGDLSVTGSALDQTVFQLGGLANFGVLVGAALIFRGRPAVHKRLMVLALFGALIGAPLAHLLGHFRVPGPVIVPIMAILLFSHAIHDRLSRGRMHPVAFWGALIVFVELNVFATVIGPSAAWQQMVAWLAA